MNPEPLPRVQQFARGACYCLFAALWAASSLGQPQPVSAVRILSAQPILLGEGQAADSPPMGAMMREAGPGGRLPGATNMLSSPEDQRLQELLQLQFDRRPQELLQTLARQLEPSAARTNEARKFRDDIVGGRWQSAGDFIARLPEKQRAQVYQHVLNGLQRAGGPGMPGPMGMPPGAGGGGDMPPGSMPGQPMMPGMPPGMMPGPVLLPSDILALADMAPGELTDAWIQSLGQLLSRSLSKGNYVEPLVAELEKGTALLGGTDPARRAAAVKLLAAAGRLSDAGKLLPPLGKAEPGADLEMLDLHARYHFEVGRQRKDTNSLQAAWEMTQAILVATNMPARTNAPLSARERALQRALELLPLLSAEQGTNWLRSSFAEQPARGMAILAAAATPPADFRNAEARQRNLSYQCQAVAVLLAVAGDEMAQWTAPLTIMAMNWAQEAEMTRTRWMDRPRFNPNYGYYDPEEQMRMQRMNDPNQPQPINPGDLLRLAPDERWLKFVDDSLAPRITYLMGALRVKTDEPPKALQAITSLAAAHPARATELANELLGAWGRARNPNQSMDAMRMRYGAYGPVYYGPGGPYGMGGQGISLTRAMQNRSLAELAELMASLRQLNLKELDRDAVVNAFTSAHSQAEVFRVEDIERVFGKVESVELETLSSLLQTMRARLATTWRNMRVQQEAKTKRTDKDIEAEVTRGYELLTTLLQRGLAQWPDNWRLHLVQATAWFDFAEFQYGKKVDLPIYVEKREQSFAEFQKAADLYGGQLAKMDAVKYTAEVFVNWFNANLGASDLAYVTRQQEPSTNNLARLRDTILSLPASTGPRHLELFAAAINESLNTIRGELKPRYTRAALRVTGDLPAAGEIRKLARYYDDLLGEISLEVRLDGDAVVGHTAPFGVFVGLRHSVEVERESGGFGRYLQNQNQPYYGMMYGGQRNAREDFEKQVREKLGDNFEIRAITFADEKVQSRGIGRPGWRETPLAYLLLKAKDGAVDRLPSFHFDLDFSDQRGQVVLAVESSMVLLDARPERGPPRPVAKVAMIQILDDREAGSGKLTLDIRATGRGLVPELRELVEMELAGFRTTKTNDSGVSLTKLDTEGDDLAALVERSWVFSLEPASQAEAPAFFHFPQAKTKDIEVTYKRYADADLIEVKPEVAVAGLRLRPDLTWVWLLCGLVLAGGAAFVFLRSRRMVGPVDAVETPYTMPGQVTPFTALKLLRQIEADHRITLSDDRRGELARTIRELERDYFARPKNGSPNGDLAGLLQPWLPK